MKVEYATLRARLADDADDARRVYEADQGKPSAAFDSGRYEGLKQALEILETEVEV
jgi:hypothetical protein